MPLPVAEIWPARNALLLLGSSQEAAPSIKVAANALPYFRASIVSLLLMVIWSFSSVSEPLWVHISQWHQELASPVALPSAKPIGWPLALSLVDMSRKPSRSAGIVS